MQETDNPFSEAFGKAVDLGNRIADTVAGEHGDTLEGAAVRLEAEHPGVAAAVRALVDALSKAGI